MSTSPTPLNTSSPSGSISLSASDDEVDGTLSPRFDKHWSDSDLILKSSDNVLFKVHRARLAGSSMFRDMFEIATDIEEAGQRYQHAAPVIQLSESAYTLESILPFFYDEYPSVDDMQFDDILEALEASLKYGMTLVEHIYTARLRRMMPALQANQAIRLWVKCTTLDKPDLAAQALQLTAKGDILTIPSSELSSVDSRSMDKLWRTHMEHSQRQSEMLFKFAWQSARGTCYYFNQEAHKTHMQALLSAKTKGLSCETSSPLGFATCGKCHSMAEELGLASF